MKDAPEMTSFHAVVRIDHQSAEILQFDGDDVRSQKIRSHSHPTAQHHSQVRTEHEFFAEVCDALVGIEEVLVCGSHTAQADFRHYLDKHRPAMVRRVVGYETIDHPSTAQLTALARKTLLKIDRMRGTPTPS